MNNFTRTFKSVLHDLARLRLPVTAAALTTTIVGIANGLGVQPFGIDLSKQTTRITAALTLIGLLAGMLSRWADGPAEDTL